MTPDEYHHGKGSPRVQFICGAVFGLIVGIVLAFRFAHSFLLAALIAVASTGFFAILAAGLGDSFWEGLLRGIRSTRWW